MIQTTTTLMETKNTNTIIHLPNIGRSPGVVREGDVHNDRATNAEMAEIITQPITITMPVMILQKPVPVVVQRLYTPVTAAIFYRGVVVTTEPRAHPDDRSMVGYQQLKISRSNGSVMNTTATMNVTERLLMQQLLHAETLERTLQDLNSNKLHALRRPILTHVGVAVTAGAAKLPLVVQILIEVTGFNGKFHIPIMITEEEEEEEEERKTTDVGKKICPFITS